MFPEKYGQDRRVQKTQTSLRKALASLIGEKDYNKIVVKEILDRANVGRSAFYTHYRDKQDLLTDGIYAMLQTAQEKRKAVNVPAAEKLIWFSLPIFEYHFMHCRYNTMSSKNKHVNTESAHDHLKKVLVELVKKDLNYEYQKRPLLSNTMPAHLLAEQIVSLFILTLNWWLKSNMAMSPTEIESIYRKTTLACLKSVLE